MCLYTHKKIFFLLFRMPQVFFFLHFYIIDTTRVRNAAITTNRYSNTLLVSSRVYYCTCATKCVITNASADNGKAGKKKF